MDGFNVEEGGEAAGKRDNIVHAQQHRRSKRRARTNHMHRHFQQELIRHRILFMTIPVLATRILRRTSEPPWKKMLRSCNHVCSKRNLCAWCWRKQWAEFQAPYLLDTGILLLRQRN
ncbi:hypothetical protein LWI28_025322 [Acer negundo]|uniref:Uncharacterized protein n=1 Tax=Acer negundo TaxID=4023 RepID=A0AAD5IRL3_ACENE|nr:hypothetical protein LWI28_025322 [Acer negundo]